jgi:hypothetical protein
MRMHRGSSNGSGATPPNSETLPLSAPPFLSVIFRVERGARVETRIAHVPVGSTVRVALRAAGLFGEGSAVLDAGRPVPLDTPVLAALELTVVPTFSGG